MEQNKHGEICYYFHIKVRKKDTVARVEVVYLVESS